MEDKIVVFTGGFDPIHSGHIEAINKAREFGRVIIGLNSDAWLTRKKGRPFMTFEERKAILDQFKNVMSVIEFDDSDNSASDAIHKVRKLFPNNKIIFVNGGDRTASNIPEMDAFKDDSMVEFVFEVGGSNKKNSSSWILEDWKAPKTERPWGYYRVIHEVPGMKVKELTVNPGCSLSMQKHDQRAEYWIVSEGSADVDRALESGYTLPSIVLEKHHALDIPIGEWHQLHNNKSYPLKIVEIQYGENCIEEDIQRK